MKPHRLKFMVSMGLLLGAAGLWTGTARALIVHDPGHTALNAAKWALQLQRMQEQILHMRTRLRQWDSDFGSIWGQRSGRVHAALRTLEQTRYVRNQPWFDRIRTGERIYTDLNREVRNPATDFQRIKNVRDGFTFVRAGLDRYRHLAPAVKDYYRALGNLSAEGLYVSARSAEAGERLWRDAERLNTYAADTSPAGAAKTAAFAASVGIYAQGYQLETLNRLLKQTAYQNLREENAERAALVATASLQEALATLYQELPVRVHALP